MRCPKIYFNSLIYFTSLTTIANLWHQNSSLPEFPSIVREILNFNARKFLDSVLFERMVVKLLIFVLSAVFPNFCIEKARGCTTKPKTPIGKTVSLQFDFHSINANKRLHCKIRIMRRCNNYSFFWTQIVSKKLEPLDERFETGCTLLYYKIEE